MIGINFAKGIMYRLADTYLFKDHSDVKRVSVLLRGEPGIGKSQSIIQVANELSKHYNTEVNVEEIRLPGYLATELKGMPYVENNKTYMAGMDKFNTNGKPTILVLEEFDKAYKDTKNAVLDLVLDYRINGVSLPDNVFIIATSNRLVDNADSRPLPSTYRSGRFIILDITYNESDFLKYANAKFIPLVVSFLESNKTNIHVPDYNSNVLLQDSYPCPRSWETLSTFCKSAYSNDDELLSEISKNTLYMVQVFKGIVGENAAREFVTYIQYVSKIDVNKIISTGKFSSDDTIDAGEKYQMSVAFSYLLKKMYWKKPIQMKTMEKIFNLIETNEVSNVVNDKILSVILSNANSKSTLLQLADKSEFIKKIISRFEEIDSEKEYALNNY